VASGDARANDVGSAQRGFLVGPTIAQPDDLYLGGPGGTVVESQPEGDTDLGGIVTSDLDVSRGAEYLVARGADGGVWLYDFTGATGVGWQSLGGRTNAGPAVAGNPAQNNGLGEKVFARGTDNALWYRSRSGSGWDPWARLGGTLTSDPDAALDAAGPLAIVARGADGAVWLQTLGNLGYSGWMSLGGYTTSGPTITYNSWGGGLSVLARGGDGAVWLNQSNPSASQWGGWHSLGGYVQQLPGDAATGYGIDVTDLFVSGPQQDGVAFVTIGGDNAVWRGVYSAVTGAQYTRIG
jgi:hypothetical protein